LAATRDAESVLRVPAQLEALAGLAALAESPAEAARLFGAAEAARDAYGLARYAVEGETYAADVKRARLALPGPDFDEAWEQGRSMSLEEAVAYASRGRGERKRPSTGWASLTPTELEVVGHVAAGLTNPQIAERLFVSRSTVKQHLAHIFTKLGVSTRTELASMATRRGL
jgi:DNA-binding CsgD family transcriptional regulator